MERLTEKYWRNLDPWECCGQDNYCKRGCHKEGGCLKGCAVPKIYVRLAAYEDTGLTPEEVAALKNLPNDPLTLDELRQMEGEPVWTEIHGWRICYGIKSVNGILSMDVGNGTYESVQTYGLDWLAYRRRPEEATP